MKESEEFQCSLESLSPTPKKARSGNVSQMELDFDFFEECLQKLAACEAEDTDEMECVMRQAYDQLQEDDFDQGALIRWNAMLWPVLFESDCEKLRAENEAFATVFDTLPDLPIDTICLLFEPFVREFDRLGSYSAFSTVRSIYTRLKIVYTRLARDLRKKFVGFLVDKISRDTLRTFDFWFLKECQTEVKRRGSYRGDAASSMCDLGKSDQNVSLAELTQKFVKKTRRSKDIASESYLLVDQGSTHFELELFVNDLPDVTSRKVNKALF